MTLNTTSILHLTPPTPKRGLAKSVHRLKRQVMSRLSVIQVAVHELGSVPFSVFKDSTPATPQTGAHFHTTGEIFFSFLFYCHTTVSMSAKWWYSSLCLLSLLCFCTVNFETVFSQKGFFSPHGRRTLKTQKWRWWVAWFFNSAISFSVIYYISPESQNNFTTKTTNSLSQLSASFPHVAISNIHTDWG